VSAVNGFCHGELRKRSIDSFVSSPLSPTYRFFFVKQEQVPGTRDRRCTCPDPKVALANTTSPLWNSHHQNMVYIAEHAPADLDVVFFGDDMIEQLGGTRGLGVDGAEGMEDYFEKTFTRKGGGKVNAIALGSSGDTVRFWT
jgi:hypothetical protein